MVTSAELVQQFEAVLTPGEKNAYRDYDKMHRVILETFAADRGNIRYDKAMTDYDIQNSSPAPGRKKEWSARMASSRERELREPDTSPQRGQLHIKRGDVVCFDIVSKRRQPERDLHDRPGPARGRERARRI